MAEVAGLVIGGAGLAALFDSCMSAFEYVESGSKYGREYNKAALKISLLQLRLTRWKETVQFVEYQDTAQYSGAFFIASPEESEKVGELLGHIVEDFDEAERRAKNYRLKETPVVSNLERTDTTIAALTKKVQKLALTRQKAASMRQKASWALHDKKKFERLIEDQTVHINALVDLFPAMEIKVQAIADSDATTLVEPVTKEEVKAETVQVLREAAQEVDPAMGSAVEKVAQGTGGQHVYGGTVNLSGSARFAEGDYIAPDYTGPMIQGRTYIHSATYTLSDQARGSRGTIYGGKSIWDD